MLDEHMHLMTACAELHTALNRREVEVEPLPFDQSSRIFGNAHPNPFDMHLAADRNDRWVYSHGALKLGHRPRSGAHGRVVVLRVGGDKKRTQVLFIPYYPSGEFRTVCGW